MAVTVEQVRTALAGVIDPATGKDLVSSKSAKYMRVDGGHVSVDVELGSPGEVAVKQVRWVQVDDGTWSLGVYNVN